MNKPTRIIVETIFVAALIALLGCTRSHSTTALAQSTDSPAVAENENRPLGCHPTDSSSGQPEAVSSETEMQPQHQSPALPNDMVHINGGSFAMGTSEGLSVEGPVHQVTVKSFWMDRHEVTVAQFLEFVNATGWRTESEKAGWSGVFNVRTARWDKMNGANWRRPENATSSPALDEPVTHVSWNDAVAYARWAKKRLPTEAEFEYAARGGLAEKKYAWGDELNPGGAYKANYWQGLFPNRNLGEDGFIGRAPVGSFPPNGYGLYDITGNVWEWCADWFDESYYKTSATVNPTGPANGEDRVIRGGSWLCSDNYCTGYRVAARNHTAPDTGLNNLGFRCVRDE